jgi:hypothetical protein
MTLTPRLVAMLLAGMESGGPGTHLFQDPEFLALNPGHTWPPNTQPPLLRAEQNADAYLLTRWLNTDHAARAFLDGTSPAECQSDDHGTNCVDFYWRGIKYPTDIFEARDPDTIGAYNPLQGTVKNVRRVFNFQVGGDGFTPSPSIDGILGVMDVVNARKFGLPIAKIVPANAGPGTAGVAPDTAGLSAGYAAMTPTSAGAITKTANISAGGGAYPLTKIDYAMVPTGGVSATKAAKIAAFLKWAAGDGQNAQNLPTGYLPMPADLQAQSAAAQTKVLAGPTATPSNPSGFGPLPSDVSGTDTSATGSDFSGSDFSGDTGTSSDLGGNSLTAADVAAANDSASASKKAAEKRAANAKPVSARFLGSQGAWLLPLLLILGLAALIAGPTMVFVLRRRVPAPAGGGDTPALPS